MEWKLTIPITREDARKLRAGDRCLLSGKLLTARDAAHQRLCQRVQQGASLPIDIRDSTIYFAGPAPAAPGRVIGSVGPTTSYRMDAYSPMLIAMGQTAMIGKGKRGPEVVEAMKAWGAVYFGAIGGCGALLSRCVVSSRVVAYEDLGAEAIRELEVVDFPVTVVIDSMGNNLYETGPAAYLQPG